MNCSKPLTGLLFCLASWTVCAQWQWVDKDGRKVFSDLPPPSDIPTRNIVKQPTARSKAADPPADSQTSSILPTNPATPGNPSPAVVDKTLMERKKQAEDALAAKARFEEQRIALAQADSCARARSALAGLDAGLRVSRTNSNGEREFLEGNSRLEEAQRLQKIIEVDCK